MTQAAPVGYSVDDLTNPSVGRGSTPSVQGGFSLDDLFVPVQSTPLQDQKPQETYDQKGRRIAQEVSTNLEKDQGFQGQDAQTKQETFLDELSKALPSDFPRGKDGSFLPDVNGNVQNFGIDYTKGPVSSALSSAGNALGGVINNVFGLVTPSGTRPASDITRETTNPNAPIANTTGRLAGVVPIVASSIIGGPIAGAVVGGLQGAGSGVQQGQEQGLNATQTASLAAERGIFNAVLGLIPGGKVSGSLLGTTASTILKVAGLNMSQAVVESNLKSDLGIKDEGLWNTIKQSAVSGDNWAQALLFGGIHALVSKAGGEGNGGEDQSPSTQMGNVSSGPDGLQSVPVVGADGVQTSGESGNVDVGLSPSVDESRTPLERSEPPIPDDSRIPLPRTDNGPPSDNLSLEDVSTPDQPDSNTPKMGTSESTPQESLETSGRDVVLSDLTAQSKREAPIEKGLGAGIIASLTGAPLHEPLADRVERLGDGNPIASEAAQKLRTSYDAQKTMLGPYRDVIDAGQRTAGLPSKLTTFLNGTEDHGIYTTRNFVSATEGDLLVPKGTEEAFQKITDANQAVGKIAQEKVNTEFSPSGKIQRLWTQEGMGILGHPGTERYNNMVDAFYDLNKGTDLSLEQTKQHFAELSKDVIGSNFDGITRKTNQEFRRVFPDVPSQIKSGNSWINLFHDTPFDYLKAATDRVTSRAAFLQTFGRGDEWKDFQDKVNTVNKPTADAFNAAIKAIHGIPASDPSSLVTKVLDTFNTYVGNPVSQIALSLGVINQAVDSVIGNTQAAFGFRNQLKGFLKLSNAGERDAMRNQGKLIRSFYDLSYDPTSPIQSVLKQIGTVASASNSFASHAQDNLAAATAQVFTDSLRSGDASSFQRAKAQELAIQYGFGRAVSKDISTGNATPEQYDAFVREAIPRNTSGGKASGQTTIGLQNKMWNTLFRYQSYPAMELSNLSRSLRGVVDAGQSGDWSRITAATSLFSRNVFSTGLKGATIGLLYTALSGGKTGLKIAYNEDKDEPGRFILDSAAYGVGGPFALITRALQSQGDGGSDSLTSTLSHASQPLGLLMDVLDYATNKGSYKDMTLARKSLKFLQQYFPASRAISSWVALDGLGAKNLPLDQTLAAISHWKQERQLSDSGGADDPNTVNFHTVMKQARTMISRGDDPSDLMRQNLNPKNTDHFDIGSSIEAGKSLQGLTIPQKEDLKNYIGQEAFDRAQQYDDTLSAWASHFQIADDIAKVAGAKAGVNLIKPPIPGEIKGYTALSTVNRKVKDMEDAIRYNRLGGTSTTQVPLGVGGE